MSAPLGPVRHVFLDRDGVINVKLPQGQYVTQPEQLQLCPGAAEAIARLNQQGMRVMVVTNQRGISLGIFTEMELEAVHRQLKTMLAAHGAHLDAIYYCPHGYDTCDCRKPQPGMFHQAFRDFPEVYATNSIMIGDSLVDIQAGNNLGMPTVFIKGRADTQDPGADQAQLLADDEAPSLTAFVGNFLSK
jgi:D-glycero-D-manno-heptose 1,7-bisphosphate phosphatase